MNIFHKYWPEKVQWRAELELVASVEEAQAKDIAKPAQLPQPEAVQQRDTHTESQRRESQRRETDRETEKRDRDLYCKSTRSRGSMLRSNTAGLEPSLSCTAELRARLTAP